MGNKEIMRELFPGLIILSVGKIMMHLHQTNNLLIFYANHSLCCPISFIIRDFCRVCSKLASFFKRLDPKNFKILGSGPTDRSWSDILEGGYRPSPIQFKKISIAPLVASDNNGILPYIVIH